MLCTYAPAQALVIGKCPGCIRRAGRGDLQMDRRRWRGALLGSVGPGGREDCDLLIVPEPCGQRTEPSLDRKYATESGRCRPPTVDAAFTGARTSVLQRRDCEREIGCAAGAEADSGHHLASQRQSFGAAAERGFIFAARPGTRYLR